MQNTECRMQNVECRVQNAKCRTNVAKQYITLAKQEYHFTIGEISLPTCREYHFARGKTKCKRSLTYTVYNLLGDI